jgi:hypothetical protein
MALHTALALSRYLFAARQKSTHPSPKPDFILLFKNHRAK